MMGIGFDVLSCNLTKATSRKYEKTGRNISLPRSQAISSVSKALYEKHIKRSFKYFFYDEIEFSEFNAIKINCVPR